MIDYIKYEGRDYPVKFGLNTLRVFTKEFDISLNKLGNLGEMTFDVLLHLMYAGLKEGARAEKQQFLLNIEEVCDMLDDTGLDEMLNIFASQFGEGGGNEGNQEAPKTG